jgi:hypothetical protein
MMLALLAAHAAAAMVAPWLSPWLGRRVFLIAGLAPPQRWRGPPGTAPPSWPAARRPRGWPGPRRSALLLAVSLATVLAVFIFAIGQPRTDKGAYYFHPLYLLLAAGVSAAFLTVGRGMGQVRR